VAVAMQRNCRSEGLPLGLMAGMGYEEKAIVLDAGGSPFFYSDTPQASSWPTHKERCLSLRTA